MAPLLVLMVPLLVFMVPVGFNGPQLVLIVESCKKFNEKAQTTNFSVLAKGRRPRKELFAENMKN